MTTGGNWPFVVSPGADGEVVARFRPPLRHYTPPSVLMTLSRLAPMIDLSFLLLIFFMTTTRFAPSEGLLTSGMPKYGGGVAGGPTAPLPLSPIIVRLSVSGPDDADYVIRVDRFENPPTRLAGLPEFLRGIQQQPGFDADTPVVIVADDDVRWDHVVNCWNAAIRAGYEKIAFAEP